MPSLWWILPDCVWDGIFSLWQQKLRDNGPMVSGFLFGLGWWLWIDAVVQDDVHKAAQFIPGFLATFATLIMNLVNRESIQDYDPFDDQDSRRARLWLLVSYLLAFGGFLGSMIILISCYALKDVSIWPGVACIAQVCLVLSSGLVFFLSKGYTMKSILSLPRKAKEKALEKRQSDKEFIAKHGDLRPSLLSPTHHGQQYFDSADWSMFKDDVEMDRQLRQLPSIMTEKQPKRKHLRKSTLSRDLSGSLTCSPLSMRDSAENFKTDLKP